MKRILYIFALMAATCCFAQQNMPMASDKPCDGWLKTHPYYYCECRNTSREFAFPLMVEVTDTMWYSAKLEDMKQGLCAYWFSDCSITFEIYAFCSSKTPTITMTVEKNQMREMSVESINKKLEEMGEQAELLGQLLTPRVRVYPNDGGSGTVYCYPYDQGPKSTCDTILPVVSGMTYVCDQPEEVYELTPQRISYKGLGFIRWKQKKNQEGTIWLTEGACDGPEIGRAVLSDSMHVYVLDSVRMKEIKKANKSIFVHVSHDSAYVGRIVYRSNIGWDKQIIDTVLCQGKALTLKDTVLTQTTSYTKDTVWVKRDTLALTTYNLTIEPPTPVYDTLRLKYKQLPYTYRNNIIPKDGWGDYDFTIHQPEKCDERYLLHVEHNMVRKETVVDTTLCLGKVITINNVKYTTDTVIRDSVWTYAAASTSTPDTYTIRNISIRFAIPEIEHDTIAVPPSQMTARGYYYKTLGVSVHYGDTLIEKKKYNTCTRWIQLHVGQDVTMITGDMDTTLCMGQTFSIGDQTFAKDTTFYDTIPVDADTWMMGNITLHFTQPELEYDTIIVSPTQMTPEGYRYEALEEWVNYGDTLIVKTAEEQCTRWIQLHVALDTTPIVTSMDTTLCLGKTITFNNVIYATDTLIQDSVWTEPGLWTIRNITIQFTNPEPEYDTIAVSPTQMTPEGYWYDVLEAWVNYGDTLIVKTAEEQCTRWIRLHVASTEGMENLKDAEAEIYRYIHNGMMYIRRGEMDYDLLGRPIKRQQ